MRDKKLNSASFDAQQIRYFRIRLITRFLAVFIFTTLALQRLIMYYTKISPGARSGIYFWVSLPLSVILTLIIIAKYVIYRRVGPRIFKYKKLFDIAFTTVFVADWVLTLHHMLNRPGDYQYSLAAVVGFLGFSWRTLIQVLMAQHWIFKIIPTICAYTYVISFAVIHQPDLTSYILLVGLFQALYVVLIFYFDYRVHFRLMIGNLQQEQWLQLNEFILNSIPENIVIMDLDGNCKFISEHFKKLMILRGHSLETKEFFKKIKNLQRQPHSEDSSGAKETNPDFIVLETHSSNEMSPNIAGSPKHDNLGGDSLEDLIHIFRNSIAKDMIKDKSLHVFNGKFKQDNQEERSFEINISLINHQFNKNILLILRDTTERDLILTLQGNIKYKDHLLDSVSHELRAPLNGNINLLQAAIKSDDKCENIKESLLVPALKCSKFLLHVINDILDMSQIKAHKLRLVYQQLNIKETLINAVQLLEFYAKKKNLTLVTEISQEIPDSFCPDHQRLSQIIVNLMNNAIKATQKGFVRLSARPLKDMNQLQICIEDSGAGMTEESIKHLFKDFTQIEHKNRENLNPASFATGLKITNDLVELLGPKDKKGITVHSICNEGSKFSFIIENKETGLGSQNKTDSEESYQEENLPAVPTETHAETDGSLTLKVDRNISSTTHIRFTRVEDPLPIDLNVSCSCAQVLVVDDDPFNIMAYEIILNSISVKYECVYSGKNAIEKMLNKVRYPCSSHCHPYKVVFMDEEMPGLTGTQTVAEIMSLQDQNLLPQMSIIGCSAHHEGEEIERFLRSGITEFIPKPISMNTIKKLIDKYVF